MSNLVKLALAAGAVAVGVVVALSPHHVEAGREVGREVDDEMIDDDS
jgi:hypothetical protein